jgi:hypothetical protein
MLEWLILIIIVLQLTIVEEDKYELQKYHLVLLEKLKKFSQKVILSYLSFWVMFN